MDTVNTVAQARTRAGQGDDELGMLSNLFESLLTTAAPSKAQDPKRQKVSFDEKGS